MTSYNLYPSVPSAPEDPQVTYHLSMIESKQQGLLKLEEKYKKKYKKYDIGLTGGMKCLFQQIKHSHWDIKFGYIEYIHWS